MINKPERAYDTQYPLSIIIYLNSILMNAINYECPPPKERTPKTNLRIFDTHKTKYLLFDGDLQSVKSHIPS